MANELTQSVGSIMFFMTSIFSCILIIISATLRLQMALFNMAAQQESHFRLCGFYAKHPNSPKISASFFMSDSRSLLVFKAIMKTLLIR